VRASVPAGLHLVRTVFLNRDLRRVELAFIGFNSAEWTTWMAILVFAYDVGGATEAGFVALIQLGPAAIAAPFASLLGDRYRRERVITGAYLLGNRHGGSRSRPFEVGPPCRSSISSQPSQPRASHSQGWYKGHCCRRFRRTRLTSAPLRPSIPSSAGVSDDLERALECAPPEACTPWFGDASMTPRSRRACPQL
jgi:hypothetical protein